MSRWKLSLVPCLFLALACGDDGGGGDGGTGSDDGGDGDGGDGDGSGDGSGDDGSDGGGDDGGTGDDYDGPEPQSYQPAYLEGGRIGVGYADRVPVDAPMFWLYAGDLPDGLELDPSTGEISGTPTAADVYEFSIVVETGGQAVELGVQLPVFSTDDGETATTEALEQAGPYAFGSTFIQIPSVTASHGTFTDVDVLVTYPADAMNDPELADGTFPVVAFHHAAHSPPDIFDDYTILHEHWASWGYIVASVDSTANLIPVGGGWIPQSWDNLSNMSLFQRATVDLMLAQGADSSSPLFEHVDERRLFVSGHSRGGGASLISLSDDPRLAGGILFEPVTPLQTPGQSFGNPAGNFDRELPIKPMLFFVAGNDLDEPWPFVEASYEQRTGPTTILTIHGGNHEWTYDEDTPGNQTSMSQISAAERHDVDQYFSTAFLNRFSLPDASFDSALFGTQALSTSLSSRGVTTAFDRHMNTEVLVDDFLDGDAGTNLLGQPNTGQDFSQNDEGEPYTEGFTVQGRNDERLVRINARARSRELAWGSAEPVLRLDLEPGTDASDQRHVMLRAARYCQPPPTSGTDDACPAQSFAFDVALIDGTDAEHVWSTDAGVAGDLGVVGRHWTNIMLPLTEADATVDLTDLAAIELRFATTSGRTWLDDIRLE